MEQLFIAGVVIVMYELFCRPILFNNSDLVEHETEDYCAGLNPQRRNVGTSDN